MEVPKSVCNVTNQGQQWNYTTLKKRQGEFDSTTELKRDKKLNKLKIFKNGKCNTFCDALFPQQKPAAATAILFARGHMFLLASRHCDHSIEQANPPLLFTF